MGSIQPCSLPDDALLSVYRNNDGYADCFSTVIPGRVTHEQFVTAFYTTWVFKLERRILQLLVARPSTDVQAEQLAAGSITRFSAWDVETRTTNQLLMSDYQRRTRSWLMVEPTTSDGASNTRLYFGSAIVPVANRRTGKREMGFAFRALLGFHKLYSVVLLRAAASRVTCQHHLHH